MGLSDAATALSGVPAKTTRRSNVDTATLARRTASGSVGVDNTHSTYNANQLIYRIKNQVQWLSLFCWLLWRDNHIIVAVVIKRLQTIVDSLWFSSGGFALQKQKDERPFSWTAVYSNPFKLTDRCNNSYDFPHCEKIIKSLKLLSSKQKINFLFEKKSITACTVACPCSWHH